MGKEYNSHKINTVCKLYIYIKNYPWRKKLISTRYFFFWLKTRVGAVGIIQGWVCESFALWIFCPWITRIICKDQISVVVKLKFLFQCKIPFQNAKFRIVKLAIRPCGCLQCVSSVLASLVLVEKMSVQHLPLSAGLPELCTMQTSRTLRVKKSLNKISVLNQGKSIISSGKFIWIWLTRAVLTADYTIITENRFIFNMLYKPHKWLVYIFPSELF